MSIDVLITWAILIAGAQPSRPYLFHQLLKHHGGPAKAPVNVFLFASFLSALGMTKMKTRHWRGRRCFVPTPCFADYRSTSDSAGEPVGQGAAGSLSLRLLAGVVLVLTCEMFVCSATAFTSWDINRSTTPSATAWASRNIHLQLPFYLPSPSHPRSCQALPSSLLLAPTPRQQVPQSQSSARASCKPVLGRGCQRHVGTCLCWR